MDVKLAAPVITMPRSTDSSDSMQVDLGSLYLTNNVRFVQGLARESVSGELNAH